MAAAAGTSTSWADDPNLLSLDTQATKSQSRLSSTGNFSIDDDPNRYSLNTQTAQHQQSVMNLSQPSLDNDPNFFSLNTNVSNIQTGARSKVNRYHSNGGDNSGTGTYADNFPSLAEGAGRGGMRNLPYRQVPPCNATMNSKGRNSVILVKPSEDVAHNLLNDPILMANLIENSPFAKYQLRDVRTNMRQKLIAIELEEPTDHIIAELVKVTMMGDKKVKCSQPLMEGFKLGVISGISPAVELEKIKKCMKIKDGYGEIDDVQRMKKKDEEGNWLDSATLKIKFKAVELPKRVTVGYSCYSVRPFVGPPMQCYKCQRLWHTAASCKAQVRCMLCGLNHNKDACKAKEFKCANCKGKHKANSRECTYYSTAHQVEEVRATTNQTFHQAREIVLQQRKQQQEHVTIGPGQTEGNLHRQSVKVDVHHAMNSQLGSANRYRTPPGQVTCLQYSDHLQTHEIDRESDRIRVSGVATCGTQTDLTIQPSDNKGQESLVTEDFLDKLKTCLVDLFRSNILQESRRSQELLVANAIGNTYNRKQTVVPADPETQPKCPPRPSTIEEDGDDEISIVDGVISDKDCEDLDENGSEWVTQDVQTTVVKNKKRRITEEIAAGLPGPKTQNCPTKNNKKNKKKK